MSSPHSLLEPSAEEEPEAEPTVNQENLKVLTRWAEWGRILIVRVRGFERSERERVVGEIVDEPFR